MSNLMPKVIFAQILTLVLAQESVKDAVILFAFIISLHPHAFYTVFPALLRGIVYSNPTFHLWNAISQFSFASYSAITHAFSLLLTIFKPDIHTSDYLLKIKKTPCTLNL